MAHSSQTSSVVSDCCSCVWHVMFVASDHAWVDGQVKRMCHRIERRFYDREYDLLTEVLHPDRVLSDEADTRRADGPNGAFVYLGHGIETSWMLLAEAIRAGDRM
eukprot:m.722351 g.722351  ORF g.722351 m.722351 type:complete len:105 (+) comp23019_c3_seq9:458-772(+)